MSSAQAMADWFSNNIVMLLIVAAALIVAYAYSGPIVDALVRRGLRVTEGDFSGEGIEDAELRKRSTTIVQLVTTLMRLAIVAIAVVIFVGLTGSQWVLVLLGLFLAGIAIAGQSIVLDYLMGIFIIIEAQFFQGDNIELGDKPWKGTVESVGLRRTVIRAVDGTVFSVSNGDLRSVANRTRVYAAAEVRVRGIRVGDLAAVAGVMDRVGREVAQDPAFADSILEAPRLAFVADADELGSVAVMRGKVVASERWRVASEIRLRLDQALAEAGITLDRLSMPRPSGSSSP
jgi:moderate conductance mechanosensitive channel